MASRGAIVTGGSTGIGRAVAIRLGSDGFFVVVNSLRDVPGGSETVAAIEANGGRARYVQANVATDDGVRDVLQAAADCFGVASVLVNNAGATRSTDLGDWSASNWRDMLETNLLSTALMSQAFIASNPAPGSHIVNIASIRGMPANARIGAAAYCAAKAGVINLTAALGRALAPNITVNAISPGFVETEYMKRADPGMKQQWLEGMPIKRFIDPAEIADAVVALISQSAITGTNVVMDGAWSITPN